MIPGNLNGTTAAKVVVLLAILLFCISEYALRQSCEIVQKFEALSLPFECAMLICAAAWCGVFLLLNSDLNDLPLIGLLLIMAVRFIFSLPTHAATFLFSVALGKGTKLLMQNKEG